MAKNSETVARRGKLVHGPEALRAIRNGESALTRRPGWLRPGGLCRVADGYARRRRGESGEQRDAGVLQDARAELGRLGRSQLQLHPRWLEPAARRCRECRRSGRPMTFMNSCFLRA